jgi:pantothenate kinase type III
MINLLIDIGNSNIKTALGFNSRILLFKRSGYSKKSFNRSFSNIINDFKHKYESLKSKSTFRKNINTINFTGISILDESLKDKITGFFEKSRYFGNHDIVFISRDLKLPFGINYGAGLGNDRIANAAGAADISKRENNLVIDFGTATTYTVITKKKLSGGMISPGIKSSLESMLNSTSLPVVTFKFPSRPVNNNTAGNIQAGIFFPALYTDERVITDLIKRYKDLFVIATGGHGKIFFERSGLIDKFDEKLSLKGIDYILRVNSTKN